VLNFDLKNQKKEKKTSLHFFRTVIPWLWILMLWPELCGHGVRRGPG